MNFILKRTLSTLVMAFTMITLLGVPVKGNAFDLQVAAPTTYSESVVVMDADTGLVLFEKNGETSYMPASTTKVMTAILAMENLKLDQMITVGAQPPFAEGSSMGFKEGEIVMVKDLLYSLLLQSANDAAEILAEAVSGSKEEFAKLMTIKAKEMGATNTIFMNPSGLHVEGENNYTTARDLALITAFASKYDEIIEMGQVRSYMLPFTNLLMDTNRWVSNKNDLFKKNSESYYENITFAKTGWTPSAGYAHTALGEKNGKRIVVSILRGVNQKTYWQETRELMEWAFNNVSVYPLYARGQEIKKVMLNNGDETSLVARDDFYYVTTTSKKPLALLEFNDMVIEKDYKSGDTIDVAKVIIDEKEMGELDLVCKDDITLIKDSSPLQLNSDNLPSSSNSKTKLTMGFGVMALLVVFILGIRMYNVSRRRKAKYLSKRNLLNLQRKEQERNRHHF